MEIVYPNKLDLSSKFGEFLQRWPWDWWATFTFRWDINPYSAKKCLCAFLKGVREDFYSFMAMEWHKYRSSCHIHSLVGGVEDIRRLTTMDDWNKKYGFARIYPYKQNLGARFYLSKYLTKNLADYDMIQMKNIQKKLDFT